MERKPVARVDGRLARSERSRRAVVGALLARLEAAGLADRTNVVVVSDHGMADVPEGHYMAVEDMASPQESGHG